MKYTMIKVEYGQGKEIDSFEANNHHEARAKLFNSPLRKECDFLRSISSKNKVKSYSIHEIYTKW